MEIKRKEHNVFKELEKIARIIPAPFYWADINCIVVGVNEPCFSLVDRIRIRNLIGKSAYDLYTPESAAIVVEHSKLVMQSGKMLSFEERLVDLATGKPDDYVIVRSPLLEKGEVVGVIGFLTKITDQKEAERLRAESDVQKTKLAEQEKFKKIADQVAHDIRSPLASLLMIVKSCESELSESARIALREAAIGIGDIANNLLSKYKQQEVEVHSEMEKRYPTMVSLILLQILTDKKYQYKALPINFAHDFCEHCNFTFINVNPTAFKQAISNLVNNAVDAFEGKAGEISLKLHVDDKNVNMTIQDNGKGMHEKIVDKIMNSVEVTDGKKDGHGIGLTQVREALQHNQGKMAIDSKVGKGTKIILTFPIIESPEWIADKIQVNKGDTIVILDDDTSIHGAWEARFKNHIKKNNIQLRHFTLGNEAISFVNTFPDKDKIFLLTDFELLKQELNGLHVIERTNIKRSILVTSHYADPIVQDLAGKTGTKILPKQLASEVSITISTSDETVLPLKKVDIVIIDDSETLVNSLTLLLESMGKTVDKYYSPFPFLEKLTQYPKDTKICMDNDFKKNMTGLDLAKKLHAAGYTRLYMLSGKDFKREEIPNYLTVIVKSDTETLYKKLLE
jgi:signal transduction histidine kinase